MEWINTLWYIHTMNPREQWRRMNYCCMHHGWTSQTWWAQETRCRSMISLVWNTKTYKTTLCDRGQNSSYFWLEETNLEVTHEETLWDAGNVLYIELGGGYINGNLKEFTCTLKIWALYVSYLSINKFLKTSLVWIFRCFIYFTALFPSSIHEL